jgi:hypothetical protein
VRSSATARTRWTVVLGLTYSETLVGLWWIAMAVGVVLVFISRAMFASKTALKTT